MAAEWHGMISMTTHKLSRVSNYLPLQYDVVRGHLISKKRIDILLMVRLFAMMPSVLAIKDALLEWSSRARDCK